MVKFFINLYKIPRYDKRLVNLGKLPLDIYNLCSCIRESFCISYSIRKENELYIFIGQKSLLIRFSGKDLRYLGPDERSQSILLLKALNKALTSRNNIWIRSTPGIFIMKLSNLHKLNQIINDLGKRKIFVDPVNFLKNKFPIIHQTFITKKDLFIFEKSIQTQLNPKLLDNNGLLILADIDSIEDKILYINYQLDQQG